MRFTRNKPLDLDVPPPGADSLLRHHWNRLDDVERGLAWGNYRSHGTAPAGSEMIEAHMVVRYMDAGMTEEQAHLMAFAWIADLVREHSYRQRNRRSESASAGGHARQKTAQLRVALLLEMFETASPIDYARLKRGASETVASYSDRVRQVFCSWLQQNRSTDQHAMKLASQAKHAGHNKAIERALKAAGKL